MNSESKSRLRMMMYGRPGLSAELPYRDRRRVLDMLELLGPAWCAVPQFSFDDAEDLLEACVRLRQEGIVLKRLDGRYLPDRGRSSSPCRHTNRGRAVDTMWARGDRRSGLSRSI